MDDSGGFLIAGLFFGAFSVGSAMQNLNSDFESVHLDILNAQEACKTANSVPVEIDMDDEVVCKNGAVMNYTDFGDKHE